MGRRRLLTKGYRHLTYVRDAFAGTPSLAKEIITPEDIKEWDETSDIMYVLLAAEELLTNVCLRPGSKFQR
jgi:hypothetical protein